MGQGCSCVRPAVEDDDDGLQNTHSVGEGPLSNNGEFYGVLFKQFANAVAIFRAEDGKLLEQNDASVRLLGPGVCTLDSLFAGDPRALVEACQAVSECGVWRGLLPVAVLHSTADSLSAATRQHPALAPQARQQTVSLAARLHHQGSQAGLSTAASPQPTASLSGAQCTSGQNAALGDKGKRDAPAATSPPETSARLDMVAFLRGAGQQVLRGGPASDVADVAAAAAAALKAVVLAARASEAAKDAARVESEIAVAKGRRLTRIAPLASGDARDVDDSRSGAHENEKRRTSVISAASVSLGTDICLPARATADSAVHSREGSLPRSPSIRCSRNPSLGLAGLRNITRRLGSARRSVGDIGVAESLPHQFDDGPLPHGKGAASARSRPHSEIFLSGRVQPNVKAKTMAAASPLQSYIRITRASRTVDERSRSGLQFLGNSSERGGRPRQPAAGAGNDDADAQQDIPQSALYFSSPAVESSSQSPLHSTLSEDPLTLSTHLLIPQSSSLSSRQRRLTSSTVPIVFSQQHSHAPSGQLNDELVKSAGGQPSGIRNYRSSGLPAASGPPQATRLPQSEQQLLEALTTSTWGMFLNLRSWQRTHDPDPGLPTSRGRALPLGAAPTHSRSFTAMHTSSRPAPPTGEADARRKSSVISGDIPTSIGHGSCTTPAALAPVPEDRDNDGSQAQLQAMRLAFDSVATTPDTGATLSEPAAFVVKFATQCGQDEQGEALTSTAHGELSVRNLELAKEGLQSCPVCPTQHGKGSAAVVVPLHSNKSTVPRMSSLIYGRTSTTSASASARSRSQTALPRLLSLAGRVSSMPSHSRADSCSHYSGTAGQGAAAGTGEKGHSAVDPPQSELQKSVHRNESTELSREWAARRQLDGGSVGQNSLVQRQGAVAVVGNLSILGRHETSGTDSRTRDAGLNKGFSEAETSVAFPTASIIIEDTALPGDSPTDYAAMGSPDVGVPQQKDTASTSAQRPVATTVVDDATAAGSSSGFMKPDPLKRTDSSTASSNPITHLTGGVELAAGVYDIGRTSEIEASIGGMATVSTMGSILESYTLIPEALTGAELSDAPVPKRLQDQQSTAAGTATAEVESESMRQHPPSATFPQAVIYCMTTSAAADTKHLDLDELVTTSTRAFGRTCSRGAEGAPTNGGSSGGAWPGQCRLPDDGRRQQLPIAPAAPGQSSKEAGRPTRAGPDLALAPPIRPRNYDSTAGAVNAERLGDDTTSHATSCLLDRCSNSRVISSQQQVEITAADEEAAPMERWHEVTVSGLVHPSSGERLIMVLQNDVSARVWAERQLAMVVQAEHALLENIFPMHVIEHIAMMAVGAAASAKGVGSGLACISSNCAGKHLAATERQPGHSRLPVEHTLLPDGANRSNIVNTPSGLPAQHGASDANLHITGDTFLHLATSHNALTVLFCDIQGFTSMCNVVKPATVMAFLNDLYTRLDAMLDVYGVYKVETIGDCYVVAGGLMKVDEDTGAVTVRSDEVDPQHAHRTVQFAKALLAAAAAVHLPTTGQPVKMRVGIHSGPAMSGVVGTRMPRFCLFGDTINTASRIESTGLPGAIHVSQATRDLVPGEDWTPTGGVEAKGKGRMQTYLLQPKLDHAG